ncbi:hypothetical protein ACLESO_47735 [Pyxidicoccus sp. 3LG]
MLHVGGQSFPLLPLSSVEPVEIALPPGEHSVRLEGGAGARAFLSLPPAQKPGAVTEVGYVRTQWPVRLDTKAVRFRVPDAKLPTPVRLQLRALGDVSRPLSLRMHTDVGQPRRLVLMPGRSGSGHHALEGAEGTSEAPVSAVVVLPPLTREVWFEVEGKATPLVASLSVRRAAPGRPDEAASTVASAGTSAMETLLTLSRRLREAPEDPEPRLTRAELLLSLQEDGFARADLVPLLREQQRLSPEQSRRLLALLSRLQDGSRDALRFHQAITAPTLVSPAFSVLPGAKEEDLTEQVSKARESGAKRALETSGAEGPGITVARRYLRARWLAASGQDEAAALALVSLYRETGLPQVGLEALGQLERLESSPRAWREGGAPLGAALAAQLEGWADHPRVRRMRSVTGRWTRWERLRDAEQTAGLVDAMADGDPEEAGADTVRKALLAPPWPLEQGRLLPSGRARVLSMDVREARPVGAQVLCGSTPRVGVDGPRPPCTFALRVDGRTVVEQQVEDGKTALMTVVMDARGRHQVEVLHAKTDTPALGLVRFVDPSVTASEALPLSAQQPLNLLRSKPGTPVVMTVLGPSALRIQARALSPQAGRHVLLSSGGVPSGEGTGGAGAEHYLRVLEETGFTGAQVLPGPFELVVATKP